MQIVTKHTDGDFHHFLYSRRKLVCKADVHVWDRAWLEIETMTPYRNQGYATMMMEHVMSFDHGKPIWLKICPFGDAGGLNEEQLETFYSKFGFKPRPNDLSKLTGATYWCNVDT